ncbi:MAG: lamin tail domain-containing protein [Vicinamibacterales bacterium]
MKRLLIGTALALLLFAVAASYPQAQPAVFINEIHYDNTGTDAGEFIEIAGPAGTDLSGYSLVLYNGANGQTYDTDALSGTIPDQQNGFGTVSLAYPVNGIQNGAPDGVALVQGATVLQFLSYEGPFTATNGPAAGLTSTDIGVAENGSEPVGLSLRLTGTGATYTDFAWAGPSAQSPGAVNAGQTFSGAAGATLTISDVSITEGDLGSADAVFTVTVNGAHTGVTFDIATADGNGVNPATVGNGDYSSASADGVALPPGTTTYLFAVPVHGDSGFEADEQFRVVVSNVSGASLADGEGIGTIVNDDAAPPVPSDVVISQVYGGGGNAGATYTNDFIELFNRGNAAVSVDGWSVQYVSAAGTGTWSVTPLAGAIPPGGYYLVQQAAGAGGTTPLPAPDAVGTIALAAGSGKVALVGSTTALTGACPAAAARKDLVGYGAASCFEGAGPSSALSNTTATLRKRGGCYDSDNNAVDFGAAAPAPRNSATALRSCTPVPATISQIQGSGAASPLAGQDVTTSGVVTGIKSNGFFLQTPDGADDGDPATSEGVFVFTSAQPALAAGQAVAVRGTAGEFFSLTQIEASLPGDIDVPVPGVLPAPVTLTPAILNPAGTPDQMERFEGMRMFAASLTSVAPTDGFGEIATVLTGVPRPMREPGIPVLDPVPPDPGSGTVDCCIPRFDGNPERIVLDTEGLAGVPVLAVTSNTTIASVTGPLDFTFGAYKLLPEATPAAGFGMIGVPVPMPDADEFTVGAFNVENFAGNETQRRKAALAIRHLMRSPDVLGHIEIFDLATLQTLAQQVNDDAVAAGEADPGYEAVLIPTPAGGTQNVGFLVKTSRVRIDGVSQERAGDTFINPNTGQPETLHDRPPLVLRATVTPNGLNPHPVIVVVNHTRSFIDVDLVGGEGPRVRAKRTAQAESIAGLLQELQVNNAGIPILAIGDYNAYQFSDGYTDPIAVLKGTPTPDDQIVVEQSPDLVDPDFANLTDTLPAAERYSFIFEGTPQALDHMLVNTTAQPLVQRYAIARGNADFPDVAAFTSDATRPERASDHDMPVAYLKFPPPAADLSVTIQPDAATVQAGGAVTFTVTVTNNGPAPAQDVILSHNLPGAPVTFPLLAAGETQTFALTTTVGCGAPNGSSVTGSVSASATTADPDAGNNAAQAGVVVENPLPVISNAAPSRNVLWPPNHKLVTVAIAYDVADTCGAVQTALSVTSSEPVRTRREGDRHPDWVVVDAHTVQLRAESFSRSGRVYTITIRATDEAGGTTSTAVTVKVPHDRGRRDDDRDDDRDRDDRRDDRGGRKDDRHDKKDDRDKDHKKGR